jgi:Family of unknown function (DUF5958)
MEEIPSTFGWQGSGVVVFLGEVIINGKISKPTLMNLQIELQLNQFAQGLLPIDELLTYFSSLDASLKGSYLSHLIGLIIQSKPVIEDVPMAIEESQLKPNYTPCVLMKKGVAQHHLRKIAELPEDEQPKVLVLFLHLFKVSYLRRFLMEKDLPHKWWYWDLSVPENVERVLLRRW